MIQDFDDVSLWVASSVDEICLPLHPLLRRPGPTPTTASDREVSAMASIGACRAVARETAMLSVWSDHPDRFPRLPSQSRFNHRRRTRMPIFTLIRCAILQVLDVARAPLWGIDRLPVPAVAFQVAPQARGDWAAQGAAFGTVASKQQTISGDKLPVLVTGGGVILDVEVAPANASAGSVGEDLVLEHTNLTVLGAKASSSQAVHAAVRRLRTIRWRRVPRRNQRVHLPAAVCAALNGARQISETGNDHLREPCTIERTHAHSCWGLCTRL